MFLPAERVVGGRTRYSALEIAERTGTELEFLNAMRRAMGLRFPIPPRPPIPRVTWSR